MSMPTYDFKCLDCGENFSQQLSISRKKEARCEKCGSIHLEQIFRRCNVLGGKGAGAGQSAEDGSSSGSAGSGGCSHHGGCCGCSGCS